MLWFDSHLDLAALAVVGRDMTLPLESLTPASRGAWPPPSVTLPSLREGGVRMALATIFTEPVASSARPTAEQYVAGDAEHAARVGRAQVEVYLTWRDRGLLALDLADLLRLDPGVGRVRGGMGVAEFVHEGLDERVPARLGEVALHAGILVENADPIRGPEELGWWSERGVRAIGLAWARPSRYAMGNTTPRSERVGLTPAGRGLVGAMDELGIVHDLSHLSDRAADELLTLVRGRIIASHSNARALLTGAMGPEGDNQRHLRDETIRAIAARGGVIGINLFSPFLSPDPGVTFEAGRATIADAVRHVEHVASVAGSRSAVGLGSDMDGGFGGDRLPTGIDRPRDLVRLAEALRDRGWTDDEITGFAWRNWARFWAGGPG